MAFEFYDPRRPAVDLLREIEQVVRDTSHATQEHSLREIGLEEGRLMASDEVERVVVFTSVLPAMDYDEPDLGPSRELWQGWRVFFDEALRRTQPLWAGYVTAELPPNLTELRDDVMSAQRWLADLWVCAELAPALRGLPFRLCRTEELAGGLWVSGTEAVLRGARADYDDFKHDGELVRQALLPVTDHLLPERDPRPVPFTRMPEPEPLPVATIQAQLWKAGSSAEDLYRDLGLALVERGARPVEPLAWEEAVPLPGEDEIEVILPEDMPGVVVLELWSEVVRQEDAEGEQAVEALHLWLADLVAASGASYGALRFDDPSFPPPVVPLVAHDGELLEGPYSFAVDRTWLTDRVLGEVHQQLSGAWRRDVGPATVWWVREGDALGDGQYDRTLAAAQLVGKHARG